MRTIVVEIVGGCLARILSDQPVDDLRIVLVDQDNLEDDEEYTADLREIGVINAADTRVVDDRFPYESPINVS